MPACAPGRVTERDAARRAISMAAAVDHPSAMPTASHPVKQSPAPTVSTGLTLEAGKRRAPFSFTSRAPGAPRVMTT